MMSLVLSHKGMKFTLPSPVTAAFGGGADVAPEVDAAAGVALCVAVADAASMKAEGGSPPMVSASAAFRAYGTLSSNTRGCSACPSGCTPSQRASPDENNSLGRPPA